MWACGDTSKEALVAAGLAKGCTLTSDCKSPLVCVFQLCHDECNATSDCLDKYGKDSGARCVSSGSGEGGEGGGSSSPATGSKAGGVCTFPAAVVEKNPGAVGIDPTCKKNSDCPGAETCSVQDHICRDGCATSGDCLGQQVCTLSGACAEKTEVDADGNLKTTDMPDGSGGAPGAGGHSGTVEGGGGAGDAIVNECPKPAGAPEEHDQYVPISSPQTWRGYHHISYPLDVEAALTLAPCAVLKFDTNAYINVRNNGSLKALGTSTNPVVFTSDKSAPSAGDWAGISIQADSSNDSQFKNVIIEYSGSGYIYGYNALQLEANASASFENVTVRETGSDYCAIDLAIGSNPTAFETVRVENSDKGLCVGADVISRLTSFASDAPIQVHATTIKTQATWKDLGAPYYLDTYMTVNAPLTLAAGVTIGLPANGQITVDNNGSLIANGTEASPVTFTSERSSPGPGDWGGIYFGQNASHDSAFTNTVIEYGGGSNGYGSVYVYDGGTAAFTNVTVKDANTDDNTCGIHIAQTATINAFDNVAFESVGCPIEVYASKVGTLGSLTADDGYIKVDADTISKAVTWKNFGIPYRPTSNVTVNAALTLEAGVTIQSTKTGGFQVNNNGSIKATGTAKAHVTFDSYLDSPSAGDWSIIYIDSSASGASSFSYTDFTHGGNYSTNYGVIFINGRTVAFDHCTFTDNKDCDIKLYSTDSKWTDNGGNVDEASTDGGPIICL